jgi:cyclopropane-fatty-acyl-phospholipid synthase
VRVFAHKKYSNPFESRNASDWMARHFFTGGPMPGDDLLPHFQGDLKLEQHWKENGKNYFYTAKAWLQNTDQNREQILAMFVGVYGKENALAWLVRRRIFLWRARNCGAFAGVTNGSCRTIVSWPPRTAKSFVKPQRGRERSASPGK